MRATNRRNSVTAKTHQVPTFTPVPASKDIRFPQLEEENLTLWRKLDAFKTQLAKSEGKPEFTFFDGPPFATGLPHYGHILAGTIKDVTCRYKSMNGFHVPRKWGWDCHGLPIEHIIEKRLGVKSREEVLEYGIKNFNDECRATVMRCADDWEKTVERCGRWIDFKGGYKTMNLNFMESVWWSFATLCQKGLVYRGDKVMPFSTALCTPVSNFEEKLNYQEIQSPSVVMKMPIVDPCPDAKKCSFLIWTTTPWTLPSNIALCVNDNLEYCKFTDLASGEDFIVGNYPAAFKTVYGKKAKQGKHYKVLETFLGKGLVGWRYEPLYPFLAKVASKDEYGFGEEELYRVLSDDYVSNSEGTCIVHISPGHGEDDFRVCRKYGINKKGRKTFAPLDHNGCYTDEVPDYQGVYCRDANKQIVKDMTSAGRCLRMEMIRHQYPLCWRSDTPLIYKTAPSWFINVEKIKDRLVANNAKTNWVPRHVGEKRFDNWLRDARDWCFSRDRYWGTPVPIWENKKDGYWIVVGSLAELEDKSGRKFTDIHREFVDDIVFEDDRPDHKGEMMTRIEAVFDCWYESGAMPYGQCHYPFEKDSANIDPLPADFIAEGLDQTRGWFYTLMVLSTALFDKPAWKNVIVNGLVLAENGKKMSKSKKNYPPPERIMNEYGADAMRLYLVNSPAVRAEPLKFSENGVNNMIREVFLPWYNAYRFFIENATRFEEQTGRRFVYDPDTTSRDDLNRLDRWILSRLQSLTKWFRQEMDAYRLYNVTDELLGFLNDVTNWYVRMNRSRMQGKKGETEVEPALQTLFSCLFNLCRMMASMTPFFTETLYQNLKSCMPGCEEDSVHYLSVPDVVEDAIDLEVERQVSAMRQVIEMGRKARDQRGISTKYPLAKLIVVNEDQGFLDAVASLKAYVKEELNVKTVELTTSQGDYVRLSGFPDGRVLGKKFKSRFTDLPKKQAKKMRSQVASQVKDAIKTMKSDTLAELQKNGSVMLSNDELVELEDVIVHCHFCGDTQRFSPAGPVGGCLVVLDCLQDETLKEEGMVRELTSKVQKLRKQGNLLQSDRVAVFYDVPEKSTLADFVSKHSKYVQKSTGLEWVAGDPSGVNVVIQEVFELDGESVKLSLTRPSVMVNPASLAKYSPNAKHAIQCFMQSQDPARLGDEYPAGKKLSFIIAKKGEPSEGRTGNWIEADVEQTMTVVLVSGSDFGTGFTSS